MDSSKHLNEKNPDLDSFGSAPKVAKKLTVSFLLSAVIPFGEPTYKGGAKFGAGIGTDGNYPIISHLLFCYKLNYKNLPYENFKGSYKIITGATGLRVRKRGNTYPYIEGMIGLDYIATINTKTQSLVNYLITFSYHTGIGMIIRNKIDIGVHYSSCRPHYEINGKTQSIHFTMFQITAGYRLK